MAGVVGPDVLRGALTAIAADLSRIDGRRPPEILVAMGGAATNIAAVKHGLSRYDASVVHGTVLDRAEINRQIEMYRLRDWAASRASWSTRSCTRVCRVSCPSSTSTKWK